MPTRTELILNFMFALASTQEVHRLFNETDDALASSIIYMRAARLADEYLSMQ